MNYNKLFSEEYKRPQYSGIEAGNVVSKYVTELNKVRVRCEYILNNTEQIIVAEELRQCVNFAPRKDFVDHPVPKFFS